MSDHSAADSERLDAALATVIAARPGQRGSPQPSFEAAVRAQRERPIRERAALAWRWRHQLGPSAEKARSN